MAVKAEPPKPNPEEEQLNKESNALLTKTVADRDRKIRIFKAIHQKASKDVNTKDIPAQALLKVLYDKGAKADEELRRIEMEIRAGKNG